MKIFIIWLLLIVAWNFGFPQASPSEDVIVSILLFLLNLIFKKYLKL